VSCGFETKACVRSSYDDRLSAEVGGGVGQSRELGDKE
jgi:hypothetical protein